MTSCDPRQTHAEAAALHRAGRLEDAERLYRRILGDAPDDAEALHRLGVLMLQAGRPAEAVAMIRDSVARDGGTAPRHFNLALALYDLDRFEEAAESCRAALLRKPGFAPALYTLALSLKDLGRLDEAIGVYREAARREPGFAEAHYGEAFALLMRGDLAAGWRKYEWRRRVFPQRRPYPQPLWTGGGIAGRSLLIHAEQGLGDTLQFSRYAPLAAARGATVVLEVQPALVSLLSRLPGVARVVGFGQAVPPADLQCPALSLPAAFGTTLDSIPAAVPYLSAAPERVAHWRDRLAGCPRPRVGLAWRGNPEHTENARRSMPVEMMALGLGRPGLTPVCLQKDRTAEELELLAGTGHVVDAAPGLHDFAETAAVIANLDLVVSVDTAVCHLAGALGAACWTMLSFAPDWRWLQKREDSPWYPTMRLFRQDGPGDWRPVVDRLRAAAGAL